MNRFQRAWQVLCGLEPPVVERVVEIEKVVEKESTPVTTTEYVLGDAREIEVYKALDPLRNAYGDLRLAAWYSLPAPEWHGHYFSTCEQAFSECPGARVESVKVWKFGNKLFESPRLSSIELQPKPRRAKGRK